MAFPVTVWFRQLFLFGIVGVIQVIVDSGVLIGLTHAGVSLAVANVVGRMCGACVGFVLNGTTTFSHQTEQQLRGRHLVRFVAAWASLTIVSTTLLWLLHKHVSMELVWAAKPAIEIFLALISFFLSKFWIYR